MVRTLNCIDFSMQLQLIPTLYAFIKKIRGKKWHKHHQISPLLIFFFFFFFSFFNITLPRYIHILPQVFPVILKNLSAQCSNKLSNTV